MEVAETFYDNEGDEYSRLGQRAARCLNDFYTVLYESTILLTPEQLRRLRKMLLRFGASFQQLRELSRLRGGLEWRITPKVHCMMHFDTQAAVCNPTWTQNCQDESQVGTVTRIWGRSAQGRYRRTVQKMVLVKRLVSLAVRLERPTLASE